MFKKLRNYSKYIIYFVVAALVLTGAFLGFGAYRNSSPAASSVIDPNYIARVNDTSIPRETYYQYLQNNAQFAQLSREQQVPYRLNLLNQLIERELLLQEAEKLGIESNPTDKEVKEQINKMLEAYNITEEKLKELLDSRGIKYEDFKEDIRHNIKTSNIIRKTIEHTYKGVEVSEDEIREAYEKVRPALIAVNIEGEKKKEARAKIEKALKELEEGKAFGEVAAKYSDLKLKDGDLGFIGRNNGFLPQEVLDKAFELEKGKTSDIIEGEKGYYIVKVIDKKLARGEEFEKSREELKDQLLKQKQNRTYQNWLRDTKKQADIEIYDPVLNGYKALQEQNYTEAINDFKIALDYNAAPIVYVYLARAYHGKGDDQEAIKVFEEALKDNSESWYLHYNFGNLYADIDKKDLAIKEFKKASELAGKDIQAHYRLYLALAGLGAKEEAEHESDIVKKLQKEIEEARKELQEQVNESRDNNELKSDSVEKAQTNNGRTENK
ncbi:SurA N-terminal domain-containing protein [Halothermothrix orenii]|uniref:peptidylprolyl isomerase n=1 Tax=Halothermothrix orenii (strain H 168 / OCM 544 / DSM 9562) TaxID=373903 RepID=B8CXE7_HALOH|nr:SurA N-terminal domain-containing protein [Halothermothrix orenii]ACL69966.1 peptidyl-prolyl cis-trans isomerase [Halothermothrix orenii H 168]